MTKVIWSKGNQEQYKVYVQALKKLLRNNTREPTKLYFNVSFEV